MIETIVSALVILGAAFALIGSIALARFPDIYTRLHGPTKATTLGIGSLVLASVIWLSGHGEEISLREILIVGFLFLTAPVSAHLLAKAALHRRCASVCELPPREH